MRPFVTVLTVLTVLTVVTVVTVVTITHGFWPDPGFRVVLAFGQARGLCSRLGKLVVTLG